jgi:hypothetical protein
VVKDWVVPVIVAVVAAVVPLFVTTSFNDLFNRPIIGFEVSEYDKTSTAVVQITNNGTLSATDLTITLNVNNQDIRNVTNIFSSVNLQLPRYNSTLDIGETQANVNNSALEVFIKKFPRGDGSLIRLHISTSEDKFDPSAYSVYATYEQGSTKYPPENRSSFHLEAFVIVVTEVVVALPVLYFTIKHLRRIFNQRIIEIIIKVRDAIKENPKTNQRERRAF